MAATSTSLPTPGLFERLYDLAVRKQPDDCPVVPMPDKVVLITGGTMGIGLESARKLARCRPAKIIITSRTEDKAQKAIESLRKDCDYDGFAYEILDLDVLESVKALAERLLSRETRLDVLMLNAGLGYVEPGARTKDGFCRMFQSNVLGHHLLVRLLTPLLLKTPEKPARVIFVSSWANYMAPKPDYTEIEKPIPETAGQSAAMNKYNITKLCNVIQAKQFAREWNRPQDIMTFSCHPGVVDSGFAGRFPSFNERVFNLTVKMIGIDSPHGAITQVLLASSPDVVANRESGLYYSKSAARAPSAFANSEAAGKELLSKCDSLVKDYL